MSDGFEEMAERGTPEFYQEHAARLVKLAENFSDPTARLELLDFAAVFQKLADRSASVDADPSDVPARAGLALRLRSRASRT